MPDNNEILIRALEASGSQREADLARAILGNPAAPEADRAAAPAAQAELTPGQAYAQQQQAAQAAQQGPTPPPGKAPLSTIEAWEALPQKERLARMAECDQLVLEGK